jgi:hypothetical protein
VHVNLEVEVATNRDRVAGLSHRADSLARVDTLTAVDQRGSRHVGVEVGTVLAFAVDQQVVTVEDRVVAGAQHHAVAYRYQRRVAGGDDVEALVGAAAATWGAEFADVAASTVRALDREDVVVVGEAAVGRCEQVGGGGWGGQGREEEKR